MKYSVVIPIFNEKESIRELYKRLTDVMSKISQNDYEVLFINDGSTDGSDVLIKKLIEKDSKLRMISFRRNLGKSAALSVGFSKSKGDYIITMDADLQDEPKEIPKLIKKLNEGYDLVSGWKQKRKDGINKTLPSRGFNWLLSKVSGVPFHDFNSGFKLYKREVIQDMVLYGQMYRFIYVLAFDLGFKVAEEKVVHNKRKYGSSKYNFYHRVTGVLDFITYTFLSRFGEKPLHFFGPLGGLGLLIGLGILVYLSILHFLGSKIGNRPALFLSEILITSGLLTVFTGLLGEMLTRYNSKNKEYPIKEEK